MPPEDRENHDKLIAHIETLLHDAREHAFHDFRSSLATPKVALVKRLRALIENTTNGVYDN